MAVVKTAFAVRKRGVFRVTARCFLALLVGSAAAFAASTAKSVFRVDLPPPAFPETLLTNSPFGINTALSPDTPDLDARLKARARRA